MGFTLDDDDRDLGRDEALWIEPGQPVERIGVSTRIGITKNADAPLRFFDPASPAVSGSRRIKIVEPT
jgi:3-methyladenine DNA glycosylase Mpg